MTHRNAFVPTPRPLMRTILGGVLRRVRRHQGRTLSEVAAKARVSMQYLSELERGRKEASSEVLAAVCDALRIELSDVLAEVGRIFAEHRIRHAAISVARPNATATTRSNATAARPAVTNAYALAA